MDKFIFMSDEHGNFEGDSERVTELINFWNFKCDPRINVVPKPLDFAVIQQDVVDMLGYHSFEELSDVANRFAFAIMLVSCDVDQNYIADKTEAMKQQRARG